MYKMKVTSKGQVTIPLELRKKMGIEPGNYIEIKETEAGYIIVKQVEDECLKKYVGILNKNTTTEQIIGEMRGE